MVERTSTRVAPWTLVEGNDKNFARIKVLKTVVDCMEKRLRKS
jgi:polyphosphate kinase 2 (PPK2 family)